MRVFVAGATGYMGGHVLRALLEAGHAVTCLVRPGRGATLPRHPMVHIVEGTWTDPLTWTGAVEGHAAVVNAVGIIRETQGASFAAVHTTSAIALFDAAARAGTDKIVQISAIGADEHARSRYHLSKRRADEHLATVDVSSVVLRPSFVYGKGDQSMRFFAKLAALPLTPVPGDGQYLVQPIFIDDLVRAVILSVEDAGPHHSVIDAGGGQALTFDAMLDALARAQGKAGGARKVHIPWSLMRLVATATDALGGRGPITRDELGMLRRGNTASNAAFVARFGFEPRPFSPHLLRSR